MACIQSPIPGGSRFLLCAVLATAALALLGPVCDAYPRPPGTQPLNTDKLRQRGGAHWQIFANRMQHAIINRMQVRDQIKVGASPNGDLAKEIHTWISRPATFGSVAWEEDRASEKMLYAVTVFNAILKDSSGFAFTTPGSDPPGAAVETLTAASGLVPYPPPDGSCRHSAGITEPIAVYKGYPCDEGGSVIVPKLHTVIGFKTCIVFMMPEEKPLQERIQAKENFLYQLDASGLTGVISAAAACAPPGSTSELPVDLARLASCFNQHTTMLGAAIIPSAFKKDGIKRGDVFDIEQSHGTYGFGPEEGVDYGFADPYGRLVVYRFFLSVRQHLQGDASAAEGRDFIISEMLFTLIAFPG